MPVVRSLTVAVALIAAFGACSGGGGDNGTPAGPGPSPSPAPPPPPPPSPTGNTVAMSTSSFVPSALSIQRNGTVRWTNESGLLHNVTFSTSGSPDNIPDHSSGSNDRSFPTAGTFNYSCTNHGGMSGSVTVQ